MRRERQSEAPLVTGSHRAREGCRHPDRSAGLGLVVPDLLLVAAGDVRDNELHLLGHQLALLPGDWLAGVSARPHLGEKMKNSLIILVL